jgi:GNAT superfamily N-acetyltransferase
MDRRHLVASCTGITLERSLPPVRPPTPADRERLAELMLDAYRDTIDYDGETLVEALAEVDAWFASPGRLIDESLVASEAGMVVRAALIAHSEGMPMVGYLYTEAAWKGHGLAEGLLRSVMESLAEAGHERIHLWVTAGNAPAERIYERLGFVDVPPGTSL